MSESKADQVLGVARELFEQAPDWMTFFREILGLEGAMRRAFPTPEELAEFERRPEYRELQRMLGELRNRRGVRPAEEEPTTVITVRLPKSVHDRLRIEAHERKTSMNRLCVGRLIGVEPAGEPAAGSLQPSEEGDDVGESI